MKDEFFSAHHDLTTPDGHIIQKKGSDITLLIENISPHFVGYEIEKELIFFNLKSTLAQLGMDSELKGVELHKKKACAEVHLTLLERGQPSSLILPLLTEGAFIGKLFAADPRRRVRNPDYLLRMAGRTDREERPLLYLGSPEGKDELILKKIDGRTIAFIPLLKGSIQYDASIEGLIPTLARALHHPELHLRPLLSLHHEWKKNAPRKVFPQSILLVKTLPLHIRTVFGRVVDELLPKGYTHTAASILEPTTKASGDIYELFGESSEELIEIPIEFYTLEPYREHVFFSDRDQLKQELEHKESLFKAFDSAPISLEESPATFVAKGDQLTTLTPKKWISRKSHKEPLPGFGHPKENAVRVEKYIQQQPSYPFLKAMEEEHISSEGILLLRYFPSPLMKRMLLSERVLSYLKRIYFQRPSQTHGDFFSHEDRSLLHDLAKFAVPVFWVDEGSHKILQYVPKPHKDSGMFVPLDAVDTFIKATLFGIYGSNLIELDLEKDLSLLLQGVLSMQNSMNHPLLSKNTPLAFVTGGGPGVMSIGNKVAKELNILSCANIVDFSVKGGAVVNEQKTNPYIDAKMTYRIDRLVERQAEFHLDFPIFVLGGIGTDFEYSLEEVRRKVGSTSPTPVLLLGPKSYWKEKITPRFHCNLQSGTINGSEWVSNCFFCIENPEQGIQIYKKFFSGELLIGKEGPVYKEGFVS